MEAWLDVPVGLDAASWVTAPTERTVVAVVHTAASLNHLLDAVELIECDQRIQVVFTQAPDLFANGVPELIRELGGIVIPWHQATRTRFDLALATDSGGLHQLHAPVAFLGHGVMNAKRTPAPLGGPGNPLVVGLGAPWLTWYGRLVPAMVALSTVDLKEVLAEQCPAALPVARVVGDLCLDRLVASRAHRKRYREALGVERTLVVVSSTWGPDSLYARYPALAGEVARTLPRDEYAVVAVHHPALWFTHGPRTVRAWLREAHDDGLRVASPLAWRGLVAAADIVLGDHGSATVYAAAAGLPTLCMPDLPDSAAPGSAARLLPAFDPNAPWARQLGAHQTPAGSANAVLARVTSEPGRAAGLLRTHIYRLLDLNEPTSLARTRMVPVATLAG